MADVMVVEDDEASARRRRRTVAVRGNCGAAARLPGSAPGRLRNAGRGVREGRQLNAQQLPWLAIAQGRRLARNLPGGETPGVNLTLVSEADPAAPRSLPVQWTSADPRQRRAQQAVGHERALSRAPGIGT